MNTQENINNNFNWLYYLLGLITGVVTAIVITESYIFALVGGVLGLLSAGLFLNALVKGKKY